MSSYNGPFYDDSLILPQSDSSKVNKTNTPRDMYDAKRDILTQYHYGEQKELIIKAFNKAKEKHGTIKRKSGELYFSHPVAVAIILNEMHADYETICAALLHDVMEDCGVTKQEIEDEFGPVIANLVEGVTKVSSLKDENKEIKNIKTINKLSIYMNDDVRVVFIKLADRLHNMRTIDGHDNPETKARIARQTLDIYAPLAALYGLYQIKEELEDLSFKVLDKDAYTQIVDLRKGYLQSSRELSSSLFSMEHDYNDYSSNQFAKYSLYKHYKIQPEGSDEFVWILPIKDIKRFNKSIYGIYSKLKLKEYTDISQIRDLVTFSIVINTEDEGKLYNSMHIINDAYRIIPVDPIIDYVTCPKNELYRCLITTNLFTTSQDKIRVRFRHQTPSMYEKSIYGLAAFWNYDDMDRVKDMQSFLRHMPVYQDLARIIKEYENEEYTYDELYKKLNQLVFPKRIYVTLNGVEFVQTYDGVTLEEFLLKQNDGFIDLNKDYYVNGNLIDVSKDFRKSRRRGYTGLILHNNDSIKEVFKGEIVEKNRFGGITRNRKK